MYPYEEYDIRRLQEDPGLDPGDPEVLYALAKCFQLGRGGAAPNEAAAQELFRKAAGAGSVQARMELRETSAPAAPPPDYGDMSSSELAERAEAGDLQAVMLRYRSCRELRDRAKTKYYIDRGAKEAVTGRQSLRLRQEALEEAGAFYRDEDPAGSRRFYELARELGSVTACGVLVDYYARGVGGEAVPELEEACAEQMKKLGTPELLFRYAVWCMKRNRGQPSADAQDALRTVAERTQSPLLRARAQARLYLLAPSELPWQDFLPELWKQARGYEEVREELNLLYLKNPDLHVEPELARYMAKACPRHKGYWLGRAEEESDL